MHGRIWIFGLGLMAFLGGCSDLPTPTPSEPTEPETVLAQSFDSASTGKIRGRVCWDGVIPPSVSTEARAIAYHPSLHKNPVRYETTHLPRVHPENHGVHDAIVFLRGIDSRRAKPWDHAGVRVEFRDRRMELYQGKQPTNAAFVQRGDKVETINHDADYHALRGRGAAFFTLPLIKPEQVATQHLKKPGLVELFDASGYYWLHAHLFVTDHPYYARTDTDGNFELDQVPTGRYEIVSWLPNWIVARKEIDPETAITARLVWAPPQEQIQSVEVQTGRTEALTFRWSEERFRDVIKSD